MTSFHLKSYHFQTNTAITHLHFQPLFPTTHLWTRCYFSLKCNDKFLKWRDWLWVVPSSTIFSECNKKILNFKNTELSCWYLKPIINRIRVKSVLIHSLIIWHTTILQLSVYFYLTTRTGKCTTCSIHKT